jgi:hypothetical protein
VLPLVAGMTSAATVPSHLLRGLSNFLLRVSLEL